MTSTMTINAIEAPIMAEVGNETVIEGAFVAFVCDEKAWPMVQ